MIFVDTSFWIARLLPRDRRHHEATDINRATTGERLVTSDHVVGETWTFLARRAGHAGAVAWLDQLLGSTINVERISADDAREAWAWLRTHDERAYSYVDATSFALMRRRRIDHALAFDDDFAAAGFTEVRV